MFGETKFYSALMLYFILILSTGFGSRMDMTQAPSNAKPKNVGNLLDKRNYLFGTALLEPIL